MWRFLTEAIKTRLQNDHEKSNPFENAVRQAEDDLLEGKTSAHQAAQVILSKLFKD